MTNLIDQFIGHYHILEKIGEGGTAVVYKAQDTHLERDVALKIIRTDQFGSAMLETVLKRFDREAKALAKLSHPNIVSVIDYGKYEDVPYLVMVYLPGGTLTDKLNRQIPWDEATHLLIPVAHALAYAHSQGVIHRDVKPNNILMARSGDPMLTDFGIAKILNIGDGQPLTDSGVGIGTLDYIAPEQALGNAVDARADVYALGVVFYEMVTGKKPFVADTPMAVVLKCLNEPLPRPSKYKPDLPESVEYILTKALARNPDDRYTNMNELVVALEGLFTEQVYGIKSAQKRKDVNKQVNLNEVDTVHIAHEQIDNKLIEKATSKHVEHKAGVAPMVSKAIPSSQENQTIPITNKSSLPIVTEPGKLIFRAKVITELSEQFGADPDAPVEDILIEALKALNAGQPDFNPNEYRIFIASPLNDRLVSADTTGSKTETALDQVLNNGDYVFFVKQTPEPNKLEIWIQDQRILVFNKPKVLIGRKDAKNGILPEIDLVPYLGENILKISRKQAWLIERNGYWFVRLDENARSAVYLNGEEQLEPGKEYEILNETRLGFGGLPNQSYLYMTLKITK